MFGIKGSFIVCETIAAAKGERPVQKHPGGMSQSVVKLITPDPRGNVSNR